MSETCKRMVVRKKAQKFLDRFRIRKVVRSAREDHQMCLSIQSVREEEEEEGKLDSEKDEREETEDNSDARDSTQLGTVHL